MSQAKLLHELQEIDLQIMRNRKRLDEIAVALQDNKVIRAAQQQVDEVENTLKPLRTKNKDLELEIQSNTTKSKATEDRLYSGTVKNPKELQEMEQEIASLKKRNEELEEQLLEVMMSIEEAENTLSEKQTALESVTAEWEDEHSHLLSEKQQLEEQNEQLRTKRESTAKAISQETLNLYDTMRKKKGNKPVSVMEGQTCSVCGIEQTFSIAHDVRKDQAFVYCVNCGRILVDRNAI